MGLLDDAIREHLELKRQRGADPSEVQKQEREAFGQRAPGGPTPEQSAVPAPAEPDLSPQPGLEGRDELDRDPLIEVPEEAAPERAPQPEPPRSPAAPFDDGDAELDRDPLFEEAERPRGGAVRAEFPDPPPVTDEDIEWSDPPRPDPPSGDALERAGQPTAEYDVADLERLRGGTDEPEVVPADDDAEDVLEETPEFLSETPEHDRLWFEQRPPRDFDF